MMAFAALPMDTPLRKAPVAVLDWETTWDDMHGQYPVSVAVIHCELGLRGSEKVVLNQLIDPLVQIREEATRIHGIDNEKVKNAPTMKDVLPGVLELISGRILAAYNLPFDWCILDEQCKIHELDGPVFGFLDPLVWAKVADRRERGKKLSDVARRRGFRFDAHDAAADALTTARVMPLLLRDLRSVTGFDCKQLDTVAGIWEFTKREGLGWERWYKGWCAKQPDRDEPELKYHSLLLPKIA